MKADMRVAVSKRMMREGMLRCLETKPLSKITVSDICRESGINRATFYNHYDIPVMILKELAYEYAAQFSVIYKTNLDSDDHNDEAALEKCLTYIAERKADIKVLFSENAENYPASVAMELINEKMKNSTSFTDSDGRRDEYILRTAAAAAATFGFMQTWLVMDINKSPKELVKILRSVVNR